MKQRTLYIIGFLAGSMLLMLAYYFQYAKHLSPCPLCIMQRIVYYVITIVCLIGIWHAKRHPRFYSALLASVAAIGVGIAIRHVYLQSLPAGDVNACAPSFNFMLQNFPLHEIVKTLFYGSGDCALITWRFAGFSMAAWSLLCFAIFFIAAIFVLARELKRSR